MTGNVKSAVKTEPFLPKRAENPGWSVAEAEGVAATFDPNNFPREFYDNPYPTYQALLAHSPMHLCPDGAYFASRYSDLVAIYRDTVNFSSDKKKEFFPKYGDSPLFEHHTTSLAFNDPPLHTRVRKLIVGALTPRAIANMEPGLLRLVDGLLDKMEDRRNVDLVEDYASAIPVEVIGNLLDVPHEERAPLREWSLAVLGALEAVLTPEQEKAGNDAVTEMIVYLKDLVARRRKNPGDPAIDILTRLIQGEDGDRLSEMELLHNCIFLLNAGHETTTNLIGNGLFALLEWPEEMARLKADPDLIGSAVEECLRFESSNQLGNRITTTDVEIGGVKMGPDTRIWLSIAAGNRDPEQFPDPDRFDISRKPNRHLAFGIGPHVCAGLTLARLEGKIAISGFLARFPNYKLTANPERGGRARFRGFLSIPARVC